MVKFYRRIHPFFALMTLPLSLGAAEYSDAGGYGVGEPGVTAESTLSDQMDLQSGGGGLGMWDTRLYTPLKGWTSGDTVFALSLRHEWTVLDGTILGRGEFFSFAEESLHLSQVQFDARHLPEVRGWMTWVRLAGGIGSDFESLNSDSFQFLALGLAGYRISESFGMGVGAAAIYALDDLRVYPGAGFLWQPNNVWTFQCTPPLLAVTYAPSDRWCASFNVYPAGGYWERSVDEKNAASGVSLSLWRVAAGVEFHFNDHCRLGLRAGMNFGGELELRDARERVVLDSDLECSPFATASLRWVF